MTGDGAVAGGGVQPGDVIWLAQRKKVAEVRHRLFPRRRRMLMRERVAGLSWAAFGYRSWRSLSQRVGDAHHPNRRSLIVRPGAMTLPDKPSFLWITQFPLFTRADSDKEFLAKGRWASTHHPFTAPLFEDLEDLKRGDVEKVSYTDN